MNKVELLAPAGNLEKLKIAIAYGADAVYFGGEAFGLRAGAENFTKEDMVEGVSYAHERGCRCYLTFNIFPHNEDIPAMEEYLRSIVDVDIDAFLVSDPGTVDMIQEIIPAAEIHLSTQTNMTNYRTANFWYQKGVKRVVLARELTLEEIKTMRQEIPGDMEIETFVHGAMCISYSGRCLLSNFMVERDANRGMCAHPCRWKYSLVEDKRPEEQYPIEEDDRGTYIMNSKDLCMIEHIPDLVEAGISSLKIEGRMKSVFYVASVVGAYRRALDAYEKDPKNYVFNPSWRKDLSRASHRQFTTGFFYHKPDNEDQNYRSSDYMRECTFTGVVRSYDPETGKALVEQRNKMKQGDTLEIFGPGRDAFTQRLSAMWDLDGNRLETAPHPQQMLEIQMEQPVEENFFMCIRKGEN